LTRLTWDAMGSRMYESGIDQGVLYIDGQPGVPWNGLTSVVESVSGGAAKPFYIDGEKYLNLSAREEFQGTLSAYTYPDEFTQCDGVSAVRPGVLTTRQKRKPFGLSYRTLIGNDQTDEFAYKVHLLYNVTASPSVKSYKSLNASAEIEDFSWSLTALPPAYDGYRRTSHFILDSRIVSSSLLSAIEDMLYGSGSTSARLPNLFEIVDLIDTNNSLVVVDNGDGTYTMTAPMAELLMLDSSTFQLTWPTAVFVDANTFTVSS
jgi:hypothetical protein